ncbi:arylformamidase [Photobacterium sp. CCB-ST2H9]|uniref:arylformamidase n=1 Tax=Photobacterium sp. CCB-ST2H9 TaxID=2912855 RepID=UPI002005D1BD|nr:arylformamidase [Photobacterium sp. CCB-ST2H9]UTM56001.1 arylformamidase [Photobacterium sp. CCB-ST2H9]
MIKIWDISQTLRKGLPVWPGDTEFSSHFHWEMSAECPVNVGQFTLSTHSGTHADAPVHYDAKGKTMAAVSLEYYIGPCVVVDATQAVGWVKPQDIISQLPDQLERVILKTYSQFPHNQWVTDFTAVAAETIDLLAERGACLIGIDSPSLDPQTSKSMRAHHAVRRHGMAILEGLVLDDVPPGDYELIAPPLKLDALDASPVRALLRSVV